MASETDKRFMRLALACARRGEGHTRPNPPVGAVVVSRGRVIGQGFHRRAGEAHAEVEAIRACRVSPRGATLYVTLEPCSTTGRTPPCTELILRSGIARVVVACEDPNPKHAGRGLAWLRAKGVAVECGILEPDGRALIEPFGKQIVTGLPWVTLKLAMTMDGRIADRDGRSKWITGAPARAWVQQLRRRADAIMVGAGTVIADDPELRCRLRGAGEACRVIVDGAGRLPPRARVLNDAWSGHTLVATTAAGARRLRRRWPAGSAASIWEFPGDTKIAMRDLLRRLARETGALHVVCEGGADLAGTLARAGLIDDYAFFYAPLLLGDDAARPALRGMDRRLRDGERFGITQIRRLGNDLLVRGLALRRNGC